MKLFEEKEVILHSRNHGCPIETIKHNLTPNGLHYTLIHVILKKIQNKQNKILEKKKFKV